MDDTHGFEGINPALLSTWQALAPAPAPALDDAVWLHPFQIAVLWGISPDAARKRLLRMVQHNKAESKRGRTRHFGVSTYYRLVEA